MIPLTELWLPILLSAVFVFIVSSIIHMALPIHKGDCKKLRDEDKLLEAMRTHGVTPGSYMFPCAASMKEMGSPEMIEKRKRGPVGFLTLVPSGASGMGKSLIFWFLYSVLVSIFAGYVAAISTGRGVEYLAVFRLTGTVAILGYAVGSIPDSIWKGQRWSVTAKFVFDGVIYGLVTAGTFGWLWPAAAAS